MATNPYFIANPMNPFDNWGVLYNEALDYFWQNRTYLGRDFYVCKEDAFLRIAEFYAIANPDNIIGTMNAKIAYYNALQQSAYYSLDNMFVSQKAKSMSENLFNNCLLDYNGTFLPDSIDPIIKNAKAWELNLHDTIQADPSSMPLDDIKKLWIQSSQLRYSSWYWANDNANPNGILLGDSQHLKDIVNYPVDSEHHPLEPHSSLFGKLFDTLGAVVAAIAGGSCAVIAGPVIGFALCAYFMYEASQDD